MRIGIIGASSQVGSSLSYFLKRDGADVICFTRSSYSDVFFDLLGISHERIDLTDSQDLKNKLKDLDAVVDFSYPTGQLSSIRNAIKENIEQIISSMPAHKVYVYMSSIMAYGMPPDEKYIRNYLIPRSSYASLKRQAEKTVRMLGDQYGVKTFNFRLGQVHGSLQSVNASFRKKLMESSTAYIDGSPEDLTNTIFINSISEALLKCINGANAPATYTLVSSPQWTLKELYDYYLNYYNLPTTVIYEPAKQKTNKSVFRNVFDLLKGYRSFLEAHILMKFPSVATKIKGKYRISQASVLINKKQDVKYMDFNLLGTPSLSIMHLKSSALEIVKDEEHKFDVHYQHCIMTNRK